MRKLSLLLLVLILATVQVSAQNKSLEYFAKVPTRFHKPGLSPAQSIRFGYRNTPGNQWVQNAGELKLDLVRVKLNKRSAFILSGAAWGGYKQQKRELYTVNGEEAFERTKYFFAAPSVSTGVSYGLFFPYYINAHLGVFKPWEGAYYQARLPIQYSDQQDIQTSESFLTYTQENMGAIQKYLGVELYRPFKRRFPHAHPMGWSVSYTYFMDSESADKSAWNFGVFWHIKAK